MKVDPNIGKQIRSAFKQAEIALDKFGCLGWIGAMVLGFVMWWPIGLAFVFYITATDRWNCETKGDNE